MVTLALLKLEVEGPAIVHTDKLQGIINLEQKVTIHIYSLSSELTCLEVYINHIPR